MSYKRQNNNYTPKPQPFQSAMSAEQKYLQIVDSVKNSMAMQQNMGNKKAKGCQIHPEPSKKCRKCRQIIQSAQKNIKQQIHPQFQLNTSVPNVLRLNTQNPWAYFGDKLLNCIQQMINNGRKFQQLKTVKELVHAIPRQEISIQLYVKGTTQVPTQFAILFYKFIKMRPTLEQINIMFRHNNVNAKALALLYIRSFVNYDDTYGWLSSKFQDDDLINAQMTVGEFSKRLLDENKLNYDGLRLPRLPIKIQKSINEQLGQININADQRRRQQIVKLKQQEQAIKLKAQNERQQMVIQNKERNTLQRKQKNEQKQRANDNWRYRSREKKKASQKRKLSPSSSSSSSSSSSQSSSSSTPQQEQILIKLQMLQNIFFVYMIINLINMYNQQQQNYLKLQLLIDKTFIIKFKYSLKNQSHANKCQNKNRSIKQSPTKTNQLIIISISSESKNKKY